ncbi:hypothetical protein SAMN04489713_111119 [Actinomadura madurae]|uniref:Uncharacterized protein n=1 Tax=Actinomadura madurae TaxID=1993 RepID=A0A1I5M1N1_9ACTN|nr:hypothetical protein SAMN04489713_111119 [Actinomadura madurae]
MTAAVTSSGAVAVHDLMAEHSAGRGRRLGHERGAEGGGRPPRRPVSVTPCRLSSRHEEISPLRRSTTTQPMTSFVVPVAPQVSACRRRDASWTLSSRDAGALSGLGITRLSPSKRGITCTCRWEITWSGASLLLSTVVPTAPKANGAARVIRATALNTAASRDGSTVYRAVTCSTGQTRTCPGLVRRCFLASETKTCSVRSAIKSRSISPEPIAQKGHSSVIQAELHAGVPGGSTLAQGHCDPVWKGAGLPDPMC